jgi:putative flavoprotein involved in K+ transport
VLWCTGYREDFRWVEPAPLDEVGYPCHHRGVVDGVPGLYFAGLPFQYAYASMLILGAGRDGEYVARHITAHRRVSAATGRAPGERPDGHAPARIPEQVPIRPR